MNEATLWILGLVALVAVALAFSPRGQKTPIGRGVARLASGVVFVLTSLGLWHVFLVTTFWVGTPLVFSERSDQAGDEGLFARIGGAISDFFELPATAELGWLISIVLLFIAIWITGMTFFPPGSDDEPPSSSDAEPSKQ